MPYIKKLSTKTKLLVCEYRERFPQTPAYCVADHLGLQVEAVENLFNEGEIEIPSKINEHGRTKKKVYRRERLLPGKRESALHEGIPGKKRPMLRRTV